MVLELSHYVPRDVGHIALTNGSVTLMECSEAAFNYLFVLAQYYNKNYLFLPYVVEFFISLESVYNSLA